ncbi:MAG: hypothetical protein ACRDJN_27745 [Chloroflexota bacterium]
MPETVRTSADGNRASTAERRPAQTQDAVEEAPAAEALAAVMASAAPDPPRLASILFRADGATRVRLVSRLQRGPGNAFVQRLLGGQLTQRPVAGPSPPAPTRSSGPVVARDLFDSIYEPPAPKLKKVGPRVLEAAAEAAEAARPLTPTQQAKLQAQSARLRKAMVQLRKKPPDIKSAHATNLDVAETVVDMREQVSSRVWGDLGSAAGFLLVSEPILRVMDNSLEKNVAEVVSYAGIASDRLSGIVAAHGASLTAEQHNQLNAAVTRINQTTTRLKDKKRPDLKAAHGALLGIAQGLSDLTWSLPSEAQTPLRHTIVNALLPAVEILKVLTKSLDQNVADVSVGWEMALSVLADTVAKYSPPSP